MPPLSESQNKFMDTVKQLFTEGHSLGDLQELLFDVEDALEADRRKRIVKAEVDSLMENIKIRIQKNVPLSENGQIVMGLVLNEVRNELNEYIEDSVE